MFCPVLLICTIVLDIAFCFVLFVTRFVPVNIRHWSVIVLLFTKSRFLNNDHKEQPK